MSVFVTCHHCGAICNLRQKPQDDTTLDAIDTPFAVLKAQPPTSSCRDMEDKHVENTFHETRVSAHICSDIALTRRVMSRVNPVVRQVLLVIRVALYLPLEGTRGVILTLEEYSSFSWLEARVQELSREFWAVRGYRQVNALMIYLSIRAVHVCTNRNSDDTNEDAFYVNVQSVLVLHWCYYAWSLVAHYFTAYVA